jgi:glycosyltransferase involved in cell wall biosynthesis
MRILLLDHCQYIQGGFVKTMEVAESLVQRGHSVTVLATSKTARARPSRLVGEGVEYLLSPSILWGRFRSGADPWDALNRVLAVRDRHFDIIHAFDCRPTVVLPSFFLRRRYRCPLVLDWDDLYSADGTLAERSGRIYRQTLGRFESWSDTYFRRFADAHVVVSSYLRNRLLSMKTDPSAIIINHYGSRYADLPVPGVDEARGRIGLPVNKFVLGYAGSIFPGDEMLLYRALQRLPSQTTEDLTFMVIGTRLSLNFESLGITVFRTERLSNEDFFLHLSAASALVLPFRVTIANKARWPSKFSDYCTVGRPIIATPISDLPLIYAAYALGIITSSDSDTELAEAIALVHREPACARQMGIQAKQYAQSELTLSKMGERLEEFYTTWL